MPTRRRLLARLRRGPVPFADMADGEVRSMLAMERRGVVRRERRGGVGVWVVAVRPTGDRAGR